MKRNGEYAHSQFVSRVYHDFISNFCAKPFLSSEITTTQRPTWGVSACTIIGFKPQMRSVAFCLFAPRSTLTKRIKFLLAVETKVQNNSKNKRQTTCFFSAVSSCAPYRTNFYVGICARADLATLLWGCGSHLFRCNFHVWKGLILNPRLSKILWRKEA